MSRHEALDPQKFHRDVLRKIKAGGRLEDCPKCGRPLDMPCELSVNRAQRVCRRCGLVWHLETNPMAGVFGVKECTILFASANCDCREMVLVLRFPIALSGAA